ncbi:amidohydrolase family protein [candidate division KSB1 bacterium]|nr:amidohydrolase family protein [candidate division KSB1 bacterium]
MSWIPNFLDRIDYVFTQTGALAFDKLALGVGMLPSDYFHQNVFAGFQEDALGIRDREIIGVDNIMWSSDYPHTDSTWPHSRKVIEEEFVGVPDAEMEKILVSNAVNLYGLNGA